MNRLIIIGNGFDMAHGLKTSYKDFINWYMNQRVQKLADEPTTESADALCSYTIDRDVSSYYTSWEELIDYKSLKTKNWENFVNQYSQYFTFNLNSATLL